MQKICQHWQLLMVANDMKQQNREWKMTMFNCYFWEIQVGVWSHLKDLGIIYIAFCKPEMYDILKALCITLLHQEIVSWLGVWSGCAETMQVWVLWCCGSPYIYDSRYKILRNIHINGHFRECNFFWESFFFNFQ